MFVDISLSEMLVRENSPSFPICSIRLKIEIARSKGINFVIDDLSLNTGARKAYISRDAKRKREKGENTGLVLINR